MLIFIAAPGFWLIGYTSAEELDVLGGYKLLATLVLILIPFGIWDDIRDRSWYLPILVTDEGLQCGEKPTQTRVVRWQDVRKVEALNKSDRTFRITDTGGIRLTYADGTVLRIFKTISEYDSLKTVIKEQLGSVSDVQLPQGEW